MSKLKVGSMYFWPSRKYVVFVQTESWKYVLFVQAESIYYFCLRHEPFISPYLTRFLFQRRLFRLNCVKKHYFENCLENCCIIYRKLSFTTFRKKTQLYTTTTSITLHRVMTIWQWSQWAEIKQHLCGLLFKQNVECIE